MTAREVNGLTEAIIGAAIEVHRTLGPGLLESAYESSLCYEFERRQIPYQRQLALPVVYKGIKLENGYRLDLLVGNRVVVDVKFVDEIHPVHGAQVLTYMRLGGWPDC